MKYLQIIITIVLITCNILAKETSDEIILRSGRLLQLEISEIFSSGIKFTNGQFCMFKQISIIETNDSSFAEKIIEELPEIRTHKNDKNNYILDFNELKFEIKRLEPKKYFNKRLIQLLVDYNSISNTEIRFTLEPNLPINTIFELSYGLNWYSEKGLKYTYIVPNFSFGIGSFINLEYVDISLLGKYMNQIGDGTVNIDSYLISTSLKKDIYEIGFITVSWNYYFNGIKIRNKKENSLLYLGLGINLGNI